MRWGERELTWQAEYEGPCACKLLAKRPPCPAAQPRDCRRRNTKQSAPASTPIPRPVLTCLAAHLRNGAVAADELRVRCVDVSQLAGHLPREEG